MPSLTQLVAINLKFGGYAKPLKDLAMADLALNALFAFDSSANTAQVADKVGEILGLLGIDNARIEDVLGQLASDGKVKGNKNGWYLSPDVKTEIQTEREDSEHLQEKVLDRHFPKDIDPQKLKDWFVNAASAFFSFNATETLKAISKSTALQFSRPQSIRKLLLPSIEAAGLKDKEDVLVASFSGFIESRDATELSYISRVMFALLSARLMAAETGADPIGIDEIRGGTFILDTNVLFALTQDASRFAKSLAALGQALNQIEATLVYLDTTRQEYRRVYTGRKNEIAARFRDFVPEVVLDASDDFIKSGVARGCKTAEEFDRYFVENLHDLPTQVPSGPPISVKDDPAIERITSRAASNNRLKGRIQSHRRRMSWWPKSDAALSHDAGLLEVAESERKAVPKTWILSLDRSLRSCAIELVGPHGQPHVFMLDGLVQMLAIYAGGPGRRAEEFAPLLTNILINRCTPSDQTYDLEDLSWLHSVIERAADFPPEKVKKLLNMVAKYRLSGSADERKLELAINRAYQEEKREIEEEISAGKERAKAAEAEAETVRGELASTKARLAVHEENECKRISWRRFWLKRAWRFPVAVLLVAFVYLIAKAALPQTPADVLPWVTSLLAFAAGFKWLCWGPVTELRTDLKTCRHIN